MNVFDFDNTIYDGDSTRDFYFFCLRNHPSIIRYLPHQIFAVFRYLLLKADITITKERCYSFLSALNDASELIEKFWDTHLHKIRSWYVEKQHTDDLIISASPEFLLRPVCDKLGISQLLASRVNIFTGKYSGVNCSSEEKVRRFREAYPTAQINECYFDSDSDIPLARLSQCAYRVSGNQIKRWG